MAKKNKADPLQEIKKLLKNDKLVIGSEETIKNLKRGNVEKVFFTSNCSDIVKQDIQHYAGISDVPVIELEHSNSELGVQCKKPFSISVVSISKGGE